MPGSGPNVSSLESVASPKIRTVRLIGFGTLPSQGRTRALETARPQ